MKFFIRKNCVLGECLHFNVEFVERLWIQSPRIFGVEIVDRFLVAAMGIVVMMKAFTRCKESVFKLEKRCIQSFYPSSSLTVLEI